MFNPSNLYAEKVFAEYPLEMWSLDDATDYVDLLNDTKRDITSWTVNKTGIGTTTVSVSADPDFSEEPCPIEDVSIYKISTSPAAVFTAATLKFTSDTTFSTSSEKEFCISVPILANPYTDSVRIGYVVDGSTTWSPEPIKTQDLVWTVASATFSNVAALSDVATIVFEVSFSYSGNPGSTYVFYVGGISAGVRAEEFVGTSIGLSGETKPSSLDLSGSGVLVSKANPYSLSDNYGYYTIDNGVSIRARNSTIPMVYGALNSTILSKADNNNPSLSVPGVGFLNESGKKFTRTLEFWMRVNVSTSEYRRIVGPVNAESTNGLYVNGPFMTLKVGDNVGSYFVGEWSRPMLVHVIVQEKSVQLKVNSETVITLTMSIADETLEPDTNEWIGFYAYDDVTNFEVDCVAIYPYAVPDKIAKKRFVYGQGVVLPESTNTSYGGSSVVLDYSFANYDKNHSFPKNADWTMGLSNNVYTDKQRLSPVKYSLPTSNFGNNTFSSWLKVMQDASQPTDTLPGRSAFYMKPTFYIDGSSSSFFDLGNPYFSYENFNILEDSPVACMYIVLRNNSAGSSTDTDTLFLVENKVTGKTFEITASNSSISYWLNGEQVGSEKIVYEFPGDPVKTVAAVNIQKFRDSNPDAFALFADTSSLQILVGGRGTGGTFTGPIYEFGFLSQSDLNKIDEDSFDSNGFANVDAVDDFEDITPAYSVIGTDVIGSFSLDISSSGSWQDYVPLSIFKKEMTLDSGVSLNSLSMLQVNVDYPNLNIVVDGKYDTENSPARFYVAFQDMSNGVVLSSGRTAVQMSSTNYVAPSSSWETEIYEVVDGSILGIPDFDNIDNIAIIFYTVLDVDGVSKNPVVIRAIDVASLAFDGESLRAIGTKYGTKIYPFVETTDEVYVSSANNPFLIYKGTTPYLYLSSKTGIQVVGDIMSPSDENYVHRGIVANINEQKVPAYDVSSIMMSIRYQDDTFPSTKLPVFEIEGYILYNGNIESIYLRFYIESINLSNTRGRIFCEASINGGTFADYSDILYYWNGNIVTNPVLSAKEWGMVSVSFTNFLKFPSTTGTFEILGKLLVDNVSIYKISDTTAQSSTTINSWNTALYGSADWEHVLDTDGFESPTNSSGDDNTWSNTYLVVKTSQKPVDQTEIYRSYLGTNKIIVDTSDSSSTLKPQKCEYIIYNAVEWKTNTLNAL
jgi:hypothetical protein